MRLQEVIARTGSQAEEAREVFNEKDAARDSARRRVKLSEEELAAAQGRVDAARRILTKAQQRREEADATASRATDRLASAGAEREKAEEKWAFAYKLHEMLLQRHRQQVSQPEERSEDGEVTPRDPLVLNWRQELRVGDLLDARWAER